MLESKQEGVIQKVDSSDPVVTDDSNWINNACSCWVKRESPQFRYIIRWGAHNPSCKVFRPTRDPVDAVYDAKMRLWFEKRLE